MRRTIPDRIAALRVSEYPEGNPKLRGLVTRGVIIPEQTPCTNCYAPCWVYNKPVAPVWCTKCLAEQFRQHQERNQGAA